MSSGRNCVFSRYQIYSAHLDLMQIFRSFIDGDWLRSASGDRLKCKSGRYRMTSSERSSWPREESRRAVESAFNAFRDWKRTPAPARGKIVARAARLMEERKEELAAAITREEGKTLAEARGELTRAINVVEFCAGRIAADGRRDDPSDFPRILLIPSTKNRTALSPR